MIIETTKEQFIELYNSMTIAEMAAYYNVTNNQIMINAKKLGLRKHRHTIKNWFQENEERLIQTESKMWKDISTFPCINSVYMICHIGWPNVIYIGESKNLLDRFKHHRSGNCSSFRLNMSRSKFQPSDVVESQFLDECVVKYIKLDYGRKELEEYLINKYKPLYNRCGNN